MQIQHYMQSEGLGPGDFLGREEDLAGEFGVSRPTLREALKLLASGNLIRATKGPGGGIFVAHTAEQGMSRSLSDAIAMMLETGAVTLDELLDARVLLEVPLAGLAAYQPDEEHADPAARGARRGRAAPDDPEVIAATDAEIHRTIAAAAGNRMIQALTNWIFEVLQPSLIKVLQPAVVHSAIVEQHEALVAAIEKGDPARAERAMKDHLLYLRDVLSMVQEQPEAPAAEPPREAAVAELLSLDEAVAELVHDGDSVALEGFTHLIPFAAGHEIVRQRRRELTLIRMTPDLIYDQMIGAGCARKLIFSWGGNPGVGSLHRLRDAVEHDWPAPLELEEHSHAGMAARYAAGASNLPVRDAARLRRHRADGALAATRSPRSSARSPARR